MHRDILIIFSLKNKDIEKAKSLLEKYKLSYPSYFKPKSVTS